MRPLFNLFLNDDRTDKTSLRENRVKYCLQIIVLTTRKIFSYSINALLLETIQRNGQDTCSDIPVPTFPLLFLPLFELSTAE